MHKSHKCLDRFEYRRDLLTRALSRASIAFKDRKCGFAQILALPRILKQFLEGLRQLPDLRVPFAFLCADLPDTAVAPEFL